MRRTGYGSDAALRFSQGFPAELIDYTAHRVAEVFGTHGTITESYDHCQARLLRPRKTGCSVTEVNKLLGTAYTQEEIADVVNRLQFHYEYIDPQEKFVAAAKEQIDKPYTWGASVSRDAPDAFDCSSFVCWCAAQAGKSLPRIAVNQYLYADTAEVFAKIVPQAGDLVFSVSDNPKAVVRKESEFESGFPVVPGKTEKGVSHVGIALNADSFVNARGTDSENKVAVTRIAKEKNIAFGKIWDGEKRFVITVPIERPDLQDDNDIIEEIGRILGYDTVPSMPPAAGIPQQLKTLWQKARNHLLPANDERYTKRLKVIHALQQVGFSEVMTSSFHNKGEVCVAYPVAKDKGCLRSSLRKGMEEALEQNAYNGELLGLGTVCIAEIGSVFTKKGEEVHLALGVRETLGRKKVDTEEREKEIKRVLNMPGKFENGIWEVPLKEVRVRTTAGSERAITRVRYTPPSKYPFVLRDIAMFVPAGVTAKKTEEMLRENGGNYLQQINLFDTFEKEGKTSYAFRLVFQSDTETLDDTIVNTQMEHLYTILTQNNCEVR